MWPQCDRFIPDHWRSPKPLEDYLSIPKRSQRLFRCINTKKIWCIYNYWYIYITIAIYIYTLNRSHKFSCHLCIDSIPYIRYLRQHPIKRVHSLTKPKLGTLVTIPPLDLAGCPEHCRNLSSEGVQLYQLLHHGKVVFSFQNGFSFHPIPLTHIVNGWLWPKCVG